MATKNTLEPDDLRIGWYYHDQSKDGSTPAATLLRNEGEILSLSIRIAEEDAWARFRVGSMVQGCGTETILTAPSTLTIRRRSFFSLIRADLLDSFIAATSANGRSWAEPLKEESALDLPYWVRARWSTGSLIPCGPISPGWQSGSD